MAVVQRLTWHLPPFDPDAATHTPPSGCLARCIAHAPHRICARCTPTAPIYALLRRTAQSPAADSTKLRREHSTITAPLPPSLCQAWTRAAHPPDRSATTTLATILPPRRRPEPLQEYLAAFLPSSTPTCGLCRRSAPTPQRLPIHCSPTCAPHRALHTPAAKHCCQRAYSLSPPSAAIGFSIQRKRGPAASQAKPQPPRLMQHTQPHARSAYADQTAIAQRWP